ncbi:MAG TPA: hypothetical protein VM683_05495 [Anaeromyxobacteraceae bacterium]|nr:hypothetical protein [Anaeromyxobacteraceae bacterium]
MIGLVVSRLRARLERRLFGLTADEIRYTFEDVRQELRATRAELKEDLEAIRRDLDRLVGKPPLPDPTVRGEGEENGFDLLHQQGSGQGEGA